MVEACNGIRYLLSLSFMAVVVAYFCDSKAWMRWALLAAAYLLRFSRTPSEWQRGRLPSLDAGVPHAVSGWFIFVLCLVTLALLRELFNKVYGRYQS